MPRGLGRQASVCVAVLSWLDHSQTSVPLRMTSDSPSVPSRASADAVRPGVPEPQRVGARDQRGQVELPDPPADEPPLPDPEPAEAPLMAPRAGTPRSALCTTVPERPSRRACWTSTRSWAAVRGGEPGVGLGRDQTGGAGAADHSGDRDPGHGPPQGRMGGEDAHGPIVRHWRLRVP